MNVTRQQVVDVLRRADLLEDAEWAEASLPETADFEYVVKACASRGVTRDTLISLLGGSP